MDQDELKARLKRFALRAINLAAALPRNSAGNVIGKQLLRSGTSVGANYRAACRARSRAEFISRLSVVQEEADETVYWLELIIESRMVKENRLAPIHREALEILAIVTRTILSCKRRPSIQKSEIRNQKL
jgi:four helix bundle protein